jgi:hypothetical protein
MIGTPTPTARPPIRDILTALLGSALLILSGFLFQGRISIGNGLGWDGVVYANMAEHPRQIPEAPMSSPYRLRVMLPLLVHYAGPFTTVADNFWLFNLIFSTLYSIGVYVLAGLAFPASHSISRMFMWFILNAGEQGPIRTTFFYPALTDTLANLLLLVLLAVVLLAKRRLLSAIVIAIIFLVGVLTRESFGVNLGLLVLVSLIEIRRDGTRFRVLLHLSSPRWLRVAAGIVGTALAVLYIHYGWHMQFTTGQMNILTFFEGHTVSRVTAALSMVYGPFILLYLAARKDVKIDTSMYPVAIFFACSLALALVGGTNTERYLFWNSITLAILTFPHLEHLVRVRATFRLSVILLHFVVVQRVFVPIASAISSEPLLRAGCDARQYVLGASPHLGYWITFCGGSDTLPFLVAFGVCAGLIWAALTRESELVRSERLGRV